MHVILKILPSINKQSMYECNAPINVKPQRGGRPGIGGAFDARGLPVVGAFDHSLNPVGRNI